MPRLRANAIEIYVLRRRRGRVEFLVLQRSATVPLPGVWQPLTGTVRRGERAFAAARRELREETGLSARRWHCLEAMTAYFEPALDRFTLIPLFAAEVDPGDPVHLSHEHRRHRWTGARTAARLFLWESQRRGLAAVQREVLRNPTLARALEVRLRRERRAPAGARMGRRPRVRGAPGGR
jgi:dATP pyrophosphohydrolase